ncbi:hypothetical protein V6N12_013335 [Hibiscus sabdariffa]|uniref:C2H2-type domain-containing protein n=2 Tax=Hibiscus sabdariffa TaxID=183260 RepID=A0ABR2D683_9ROSI
MGENQPVALCYMWHMLQRLPGHMAQISNVSRKVATWFATSPIRENLFNRSGPSFCICSELAKEGLYNITQSFKFPHSTRPLLYKLNSALSFSSSAISISMEKTPRICAICSRSFANGKAMGGHMRSHFLKLKLAIPFSSSSSSSSSNPPPSSLTKRQLPAHPDSPVNPAARRSKRLRKLALNSPSHSLTSSLSAEEAAMCLLMLSRDHHQQKQKAQTEEQVEDDESLEEDDGNGGGEDMDDEFCINIGVKGHPKYYKCETCNKSFRSHQALGGHRASHNHRNNQIIEEEGEEDEEVDCGDDQQIHQQRIFECPFCDKVFQSGQALGGHKKVHFAYLPVVHQDKSSLTSSTLQSFDLNLPASRDDDEVNLVENSRPWIHQQTV